MKVLRIAITALCIMSVAAFTTGDPLLIGSLMPKADVKMMNVDGSLVNLKDAMGSNGILVMFSCNTCPYVIKNQQRTIAINDFAKKNNLGVILLNSNEANRGGEDSREAMRNYAEGQKYNWPYVIDKNHALADAFGANRTPEVFLFDKNAKLVYHGAIDDNPTDGNAVTRQHLREAIKELSAGKDITVKETRSVGCAIKRLKN